VEKPFTTKNVKEGPDYRKSRTLWLAGSPENFIAISWQFDIVKGVENRD